MSSREMFARTAAALVVSAALAAAGDPSWAEPAAPAEKPAEEPRPRLVPIALSIVPGVLLHGSGHYAAGERDVARRLLIAEGIGVGMIGAGGAYLVATGASRHFAGPPIALLVGGVGLFTGSWLADIYGTAGGGHDAAADAGAPIDLEAGYGHVYDPRFAYRHFAVAAASVRLGATRLAPSTWIALDDDNQRLRLEAAYRFVGARSRWPTADGSTLELVGAATHHRYPGDGFAVTTGELVASGRLDLVHLGDGMAGSFAEFSAGIGTEVTNYYHPGAGADAGELLLLRFGYGVFIGRPGRIHGEASIYYDHRRDTFTGGLSPGNGPGSGFAGFVGAELLLYTGERWGIRAHVEQGAARVAHLGLVTRFGSPP